MKTASPIDCSITHVHGSAVTDDEIRWLLKLWGEVDGNIVEVGTQCGLTARRLAMECPSRLVFTVDTVHPTKMCWEQAGEQPSIDNVGWHCRGLPNVFLSIDGFEMFRMDEKRIRMAFIDGDHSMVGVSIDTRKVLDYARDLKSPFAIAWHDYNPGDGGWCAVSRVVDDLHRSGIIPEPTHVSGTRLAFVVLNR